MALRQPPKRRKKPPRAPGFAEAVCPRCNVRHALTTASGAKRCQKHRSRPVDGAMVQCGGAADLTGAGSGECCPKHGSKTPVGVASPHFRTGATSKLLPALPPGLRGYAEAAVGDHDLINLRRHLALAEARTVELVDKLTNQSTGELVEKLAGVFAALDALARTKAPDPKRLTEEIAKAREIMALVQSHDATWRQIGTQQEIIRRLADTERRRLEALHQYISAEGLDTLAAGFLDILRRRIRPHPDGPTMLQGIATEIAQLLRFNQDRVRAPGDIDSSEEGDL